MLYQLHHQFSKNGIVSHTKFKAQRDVNNFDELKEFIKETKKEFPLSEDAIWLCCNEDSEYFVKTLK